jgi:hypothetical protein
MQLRRTLPPLLVLGMLLLGCGDPVDGPGAQASVTDRRTDTGATPTLIDRPTSSPANPGQPDGRPRPPLRLLTAVLRDAGAHSVGQVEPPHGAESRILSGRFDGTLFVATAGRAGAGHLERLREVGSSERSGIVVRLMRNEDGRYTALRCDGVAWLFGIPDGAGQGSVPFLENLANAVADVC